MEKETRWYWEILEKAWNHRHKKTGLLLFLLLWTALIALFLIPNLSNNYVFFELYKIESLVIFYIIGWTIIFISWVIIRKVPKFKNNEIGIIFAFTNKNKKTNKTIKDLYNALSIKLNNEYRNLDFKIKKVSPEFAPTTIQNAHSMRNYSNATLIISGNVEEGRKQGREVSTFMPLNFTYGVFNKKFGGYVYKDKALESKEWTIRHSDDLIDTESVCNNITNFAQYLIVSTLTARGYIEQSIDAIKTCLPNVRRFRDSLIEERMVILNNINYAFVIKKLNVSYEDKNNTEKINKVKKIIKEMINNDSKNPNAYLIKSIIEFLENKLADAKNSIAKAMHYAPTDDPAAHYSMAFLNFYDGKIEYGWTHLKSALLMPVHGQLPSIISFYEDVLRDSPDKFILNFPLGVLYYKELGEKKTSK